MSYKLDKRYDIERLVTALGRRIQYRKDENPGYVMQRQEVALDGELIGTVDQHRSSITYTIRGTRGQPQHWSWTATKYYDAPLTERIGERKTYRDRGHTYPGLGSKTRREATAELLQHVLSHKLLDNPAKGEELLG